MARASTSRRTGCARSSPTPRGHPARVSLTPTRPPISLRPSWSKPQVPRLWTTRESGCSGPGHRNRTSMDPLRDHAREHRTLREIRLRLALRTRRASTSAGRCSSSEVARQLKLGTALPRRRPVGGQANSPPRRAPTRQRRNRSQLRRMGDSATATNGGPVTWMATGRSGRWGTAAS